PIRSWREPRPVDDRRRAVAVRSRAPPARDPRPGPPRAAGRRPGARRRQDHLPAGRGALRQGQLHPLPPRPLLVRLLAGGRAAPVPPPPLRQGRPGPPPRPRGRRRPPPPLTLAAGRR